MLFARILHAGDMNTQELKILREEDLMSPGTRLDDLE